jgi:hypothetical protein
MGIFCFSVRFWNCSGSMGIFCFLLDFGNVLTVWVFLFFSVRFWNWQKIPILSEQFQNLTEKQKIPMLSEQFQNLTEKQKIPIGNVLTVWVFLFFSVRFWNCSDSMGIFCFSVRFWNCSDSMGIFCFSVRFWNCSDSMGTVTARSVSVHCYLITYKKVYTIMLMLYVLKWKTKYPCCQNSSNI